MPSGSVLYSRRRFLTVSGIDDAPCCPADTRDGPTIIAAYSAMGTMTEPARPRIRIVDSPQPAPSYPIIAALNSSRQARFPAGYGPHFKIFTSKLQFLSEDCRMPAYATPWSSLCLPRVEL